MELFAEGMEVIVSTQRRVALHYFNDGSINLACPPLKALLDIMRDDQPGDQRLDSTEFRTLFTRESLLASDWYRARLETRRNRELALWQRHQGYLGQFLAKPNYSDESRRLDIEGRLERVRRHLQKVSAPGYVDELRGTIGTSPLGI